MTTSLAALAVYALTRGVISSRVLRVVLAASVALLPVMAFENLANITNVIWPLTFACFWALVREPRTRADILLGGAVAFIGAASAGLTLLFLPLAAWALWTRRTRAQAVVVGAFAAAALFQVVMWVSDSSRKRRSTTRGDFSLGLLRLFATRVLASTAVGENWARELVRAIRLFGLAPDLSNSFLRRRRVVRVRARARALVGRDRRNLRRHHVLLSSRGSWKPGNGALRSRVGLKRIPLCGSLHPPAPERHIHHGGRSALL